MAGPLGALVEAFDTCEEQGWASLDAAVDGPQLSVLVAAVADVALTELEPEVGPVRQRGASGVALVAGRPRVEAFAERLAVAAAATMAWRPDELAVTAYDQGDGISPHRDNGFYEGFVAVLTLAGRAELRCVADRAGDNVLGRWETGPGHLTLLRGPRPRGEARPLHQVGPAGPGGRRVLTLRRNARGAGSGWG